MSDELATLQKLRAVARRYVNDLQHEVDVSDNEKPLGDREKSVRSLRTLLKIIEEIAELEERFKRAGTKGKAKEIDSKQRLDLARRIEALRGRN